MERKLLTFWWPGRRRGVERVERDDRDNRDGWVGVLQGHTANNITSFH
jgi:hypothetical protein